MSLLVESHDGLMEVDSETGTPKIDTKTGTSKTVSLQHCFDVILYYLFFKFHDSNKSIQSLNFDEVLNFFLLNLFEKMMTNVNNRDAVVNFLELISESYRLTGIVYKLITHLFNINYLLFNVFDEFFF